MRIRVLWLALAFLLPGVLSAQPRHNDTPQPPGASSPEDAAKRIADFRRARLNGDFCVLFELVHQPRRGAETKYEGTLWGTWNEQGALTRFQIRPIAPKTSGNQTATTAGTWEWLVQNGPAPKVWVLAPGATAAREVPSAEWRQPLFPGLVYSPFDILMPFAYWPEQYSGPARVLDRAVDVYTMQPPKSDPGARPVKIFLDREFPVFVRVEFLDDKGKTARTLDLGGLCKVQDEALFSTFGLLDETKRDYDVLTLKAAALHQKLAPATFDPAKLATPAAVPPLADWKRL